MHDFLGGGAAHDGIIHQQHVFAFELAGNGIELLPHRFFADGLPGHDEGTAHIAVFDKTFAIRQAQRMRQLHGAGAAGFGYGNNGVDLAGRQERDQPFSQRFAHLQTSAVYRHTINGGVGPGQINVFKQAGIECGGVSALLRAHAPLQIHKHRFAGGDIAVKRNAQPFERDGFAGQHDRTVFAVPHAQRANAVGIAKSQ